MHIKAGQHNLGTIQVTIDGRDITNCCFELNTDEGWAKVYERNEQGIFRRDGFRKMIENTLHGKVEVTKMQAA